MDAFNLQWLSQQDIPLSVIVTFLASVSFVLLVFKFVVLSGDEESPVTFKVAAPEQCKPGWEGKILDEPAIKVRFISLQQHIHKLTMLRLRGRPPSNAIVRPMVASSDASILPPLMASIEPLSKHKKHRRNG